MNANGSVEFICSKKLSSCLTGDGEISKLLSADLRSEQLLLRNVLIVEQRDTEDCISRILITAPPLPRRIASF